jgi:hypothetical protein
VATCADGTMYVDAMLMPVPVASMLSDLCEYADKAGFKDALMW